MTSKEKFYRDKRFAIMRNCSLMIDDILMSGNRSKLGMINLKFLKEIEQQLKIYYGLFFPSAKIPRKIGESSD